MVFSVDWKMLIIKAFTDRHFGEGCLIHYSDVIMTMMASQITSLTVVYSTVYPGADQRKHQSSASLAFVWGIHRGRRWIPRTKGQLRGQYFHLMTSSWNISFTASIYVRGRSGCPWTVGFFFYTENVLLIFKILGLLCSFLIWLSKWNCVDITIVNLEMYSLMAETTSKILWNLCYMEVQYV